MAANLASASAPEDCDEPPSKLRMVKPQELVSAMDKHGPTDFMIVNGRCKFPVHRAVLSQHSDYFKALLQGSTRMLEAQQNEVDLQSIDGDVIKLVISFMYSHDLQLDISFKDIGSYLDACSHLQIHSLMEYCSKWMCQNFTPNHFRFIVDLANTYSLPEVVDYALEQIARGFEVHYEDESLMKEIEVEEMYWIISKDCLQVSSELRLMNRIEEWLKNLSDGSEDVRERFLCKIRYPLMSSTELRTLCAESYPFPVADLICYARKCRHSLSNRNLVRYPLQTRIRNTEPCLILAVQNSITQNQEIVACTKDLKTNQTDTYTLLTKASYLKTCGVVTVDNLLYTISVENYGGLDIHSLVRVMCYDPCTRITQPLINPLSQFIPSGIAALGNKIYICGGVSRSNTVFVATCEALDLETLNWEPVFNLPYPVNHCSAAAVGGVLYVSGGQLRQADARVAITNHLHAYHPVDTQYWVERKGMTVGRRGHAMLAHQDKYLLVCGGLTASPVSTSRPAGGHLKNVHIERYDVTTDQWTQLSGGMTLMGPSAGHFTILPHLPKNLYSLGHELRTALENEVWCTELDEDGSTVKGSKCVYLLPEHYRLTHASASHLYLNFNDKHVKNPLDQCSVEED